MALPNKALEVSSGRVHEMRTTPPKLERWLEDQGYCLRLMSNDDGMASLVAADECRPLRIEDLPDPTGVPEAEKQQVEALLKELLVDVRNALFEQKPEGTFERGDIRLFVQGLDVRQACWDRTLKEMREQESVETVYGQIEEMNETLAGHAQGGVVPGWVQPTSVAPAGAHASGGQRELSRNLSLQELMDQQPQGR